jgi:DNA repair exonuclease SbcCD ATPase subunit
MIHSLTIQGYQSLRKRTGLVLGRFTVVTGATGSGKTAVTRALRLLAFNARGTSYVSHGAKEAVVCLAFPVPGDRPYGAVAIVRGSRGADKYTITTAAEAGEPEIGPEFTKLGGKVPDQISGLLRLTDLNFAGQFDKPFLLDETGSEVARVLGKLTNVTLLFEAAREGNRRRLEVKRDLDRTDKEIARLQAEANRFARLREQILAVQSAEQGMAVAVHTESQVTRLRSLCEALRAAQAASRAVVLPEVPDLTALEQAWEERVRLSGHVYQLKTMGEHRKIQAKLAESFAYEAGHHEAEAAAILERAGVCPTCGRSL